MSRTLDLDKQSLSYASVFGMMEDLQLHGTQFSWLGSIFYVGQLVAEFSRHVPDESLAAGEICRMYSVSFKLETSVQTSRKPD